MRTKLFAQPSVREIQTIRSMASVETKEDIKQKKFTKTLFIHYTHEKPIGTAQERHTYDLFGCVPRHRCIRHKIDYWTSQ